MTRNFVHTTPDTNLKECAKIMVKKRVGSLLIKEKDSDKLLGILTEKDIIWAIVKKSVGSLHEIEAKDLMRKKVVTAKPSEDVIEAVNKFRKKKLRRLPVVENGRLIGMLTSKDILRIDPGLFQMLAETIKIKEETAKLKIRALNGNGLKKTGICEECGEYDVLIRDELQLICSSCYDKR
jgi:CBS domain-containing protein